uniref:Secreted protein n=1 Tax=Plectus sambesii TaxID=2011161 RepID=A0A914UKV9_9BILA
MRVACCNLLTICAIASGITTIAAAPEPKYRPPSFDASMLVTDIEGCAVKIKEKGVYQLSGQTQPSPGHFPRYCTVKLLAPVSYRVVITFDHSS